MIETTRRPITEEEVLGIKHFLDGSHGKALLDAANAELAELEVKAIQAHMATRDKPNWEVDRDEAAFNAQEVRLFLVTLERYRKSIGNLYRLELKVTHGIT